MFILSIGTSLFEVLPLCFRNSHYFKNCYLFHSFVDSCTGTICHHKDFTWLVLLRENFISPRNNFFHTQIFFSGKVQIPKWAPFAPNGTANQIAGKSWNHRGQYWTLNSHTRPRSVAAGWQAIVTHMPRLESWENTEKKSSITTM